MQLFTSDSHAALWADIEIGANALVIHYIVENRSRMAIHLFNRIWDRCRADGYQVDPDRVDIEIRQEQAIVSKKLAARPEDMDFEFMHIPCVTEVMPSASFTEHVSVALPLVPRTPYLRDVGTIPRRRPLWFELGFARGGPFAAGAPTVTRIPGGTALHFATFTQSRQCLLTLGPFGDVPTLED